MAYRFQYERDEPVVEDSALCSVRQLNNELYCFACACTDLNFSPKYPKQPSASVTFVAILDSNQRAPL
jgi:hypothetical protein